MTFAELQKMTVIALRSYAKEHKIVLGAGVSKADIIDKIISADLDSPEEPAVKASAARTRKANDFEQLSIYPEEADDIEMTQDTESRPVFPSKPAGIPSFPTRPAPTAPIFPSRPETTASIQRSADASVPVTPQGNRSAVASGFAPRVPQSVAPNVPKQAPNVPSRFSSTPAYQASTQARPAWQNTTPSGRTIGQDASGRPVSPHPAGYVSRFGPGTKKATTALPGSLSSTPAPVIQPLSERHFGPGTGAGTRAPVAKINTPEPAEETIDFSFNNAITAEERALDAASEPAPFSAPVQNSVPFTPAAPAPVLTGTPAPVSTTVPTPLSFSTSTPKTTAFSTPIQSPPVFGAQPQATVSYSVPAPSPATVGEEPAEEEVSPLTLEELLSGNELEDGKGVLELHPDGYGFLRAPSLMPSSGDIYVSIAQIRRFNLRNGDTIEGRIRPRRAGDRYAALLLVNKVNGMVAEDSINRCVFDELTPVYPSRRISLETKDQPSSKNMRLIDLIAPIGFGQRGLLLCPQDTEKRDILRDFANTISLNYPDVKVLTLLVDTNPEDVTLFRESVQGDVLASTFDQPPEAHLRLADLVLEYAMRCAEQKQDVVLIVDSLTRLAKLYSTAAAQSGRATPGTVNPVSLFKAKKLFGAARCLREGGSLTVIATMDTESGNRVDDAVVEEFKGSANMMLTFDRGVAMKGIQPALNLGQSYTRNNDLLINDQQKEGLACIRALLGNTRSAEAIPQLIAMMDKADTNAQLLIKMKAWFAMMNNAR